MTAVRRITHVLGIIAVLSVAVLLALEVTDSIGGSWRDEIADGFVRVGDPEWHAWISAVSGLALALLGIVMVAAQFAPQKRGLRVMHEVSKDRDGETRISGRAAIRAACREVETVDGVVACSARIVRKKIHLEVQIDDRADVVILEAAVRERLGHGFWIDLGLADFALNLLITHHPKPPRVR